MSDTRSITFTFCLCLVCSLLLTAAATGLKPRQEANARLDRQKNVLKAAGLLDEGKKLRPADVEKLFAARIQSVVTDSTGTPAPMETGEDTRTFFLRKDREGKNAEGYVLPLESRGLWGKIYGYLALEADGITVSGFTVYGHQETPGLGGEIEGKAFQQGFSGKRILDETHTFQGLKIAKGKATEEKEHTVDGISGATLTGTYLSEGLMQTLKHYEPVSRHFRDGKGNTYLGKEAP